MRGYRPASYRRRAGQMGFSMTETMIVVAIIGILVNLAVPVYQEARLRAQVAAIVTDARLVRTAVSDYYLTNREWPASATAGVVPSGLEDYLGDKVNWSEPYLYDYDYFADADGNPTQPETGVLVGFSIRSGDAKLLALIAASDVGPTTQTWGNGVTFVIQPVDDRGASGPDPVEAGD